MSFKLQCYNGTEGISIKIADYPKMFQTMCEELVEQNQAKSLEHAKEILKDQTVFLELYYEKGRAVFGLDSNAVEGCGDELFSPYTGEHPEPADDEEDEDYESDMDW